MSVSKNNPNIHGVLDLFVSSFERESIDESPAAGALFEQRMIIVDPAKYQAFMDRLNEPPAPNAALCKTMLTPEVWFAKRVNSRKIK